ncbi:USP47 [Mytilus edulis]|uniref:Ubiquitin carboxyl-terminal hydrolase n=1 Tax=Mytilus edulis TaxID=6550 RepID=A0A8S3QWP7_MYTED|nr:USP47 [Mytilus edulis]
MVTGDNSQVVPTENVCVAEEPLDSMSSTSIGDVIDEISKLTRYIASSINIKYNKQVAAEMEEISLYTCAKQKLSDICMLGTRRHEFTVVEKEDTLPQKLSEIPPAPDPPSYDSVASTSSSYISGSTPANETVSTYPDSGYTYASIMLKSDTGYVGLVNQAMTCYLNSLIQTLYMTPEFRNALYRWEFDGSEDEAFKSIPYQSCAFGTLQKLFLQLQTSKKRAVETTELTRSFGWDSSEVWQQHDVQELCRVMFDALESKWRNTDQANLINHLYQGKMKDYVKCLECNNESARVDAYLDIPLVIRPFGSQTAYSSVREAIDAFVQPEILNDTNQYFCEKCNKKCDAHKGFKFETFPYLLTLQLKRFDFDYNTMHRIKLNERMTFPDVLNLNHLVESTTNSTECASEKVIPDPAEDSSDEGIDEGIEVENCVSGASSGSDSSSLLNEAAANSRNAQEMKGPYMYELFSIMIHSGSAAGGHYYAYIKCFIDGQWYSFNDQHVSKITYEEITKKPTEDQLVPVVITQLHIQVQQMLTC